MKKTLCLVSAAAIATAGLYSCQSQASKEAPKKVLDLTGIDSSVRPQDNFFLYANGTWLKQTEIPASKSGWGSFYLVRDNALRNMRTILDSCMKLEDPSKGTVAQQIGDLYATALDSTAIEKAGLTPLTDELQQIDAIQNAQDVLKVITDGYQNGHSALFSFYVAPDDKNSDVERAHFNQGGLGMPNRNYYFDKDGNTQKVRDAYKKYVTTIFSLIGDGDNAAEDAADVIAFETKLAAASKTPVELRDPQANYHLLTIPELQAQAPALNWETLIGQLNIKVDTLLVGQPAFYQKVSALLQNTPIDVWKKYLKFHLVNDYANWLSKPFAEARFAFYNKTLGGQQKPEARWKRASSLVNHALGDALGQLYVARYFPPEAKEYMKGLVNNLQDAYEERIRNCEWMSDETKEKAIDKLNAFTKKIGYPDHWKDYSAINVNRKSLIGNLQRISRWHYNYNINKLGKPVDKSEWHMTAPTVNAYYNPSFNEIVFPAGILQPPFYFQHGDDAVNYGAIGYVIGHEMTHGFDDQGSQYDKNGNLKNWWTEEDREKFEARAQKVVEQYNQYVVLDSVHVNGELTEGENIADIGGLAIAYAAFKKTKEGQNDTLRINGLTPDQRFFLSCAQVWRIKTRPERMMWRINNDPHSPEMYRVNGPLSNMPAFYKAFDVQPGDEMYRPDSLRVHIW